jgi:type IV secretion system protein VirB6
MKKKKGIAEQERTRRAELMYAGYEGIKRAAVMATVGEKGAAKLSGKLTGAAWYDFQYNDPMLRTYNETLADQQRDLKAKEVAEQIKKESAKAGADVLSYEYQLRAAQAGRTDAAALFQSKVRNDVYAAVTKGEDPVLMGDKFMKEKATDSQMQDMIDRAHEVKEKMIAEDKYLAKEGRYEDMRDIAEEKIKERHKDLEDHFKRSDIKAEEMPELIRKMHAEKGTDAKEDLEELGKALQDFDHSQKALQKIDEHKQLIDTEVQKHVDTINNHRKAAGMPTYEGTAKPRPPAARPVVGVNELLKK